MLLKVHEMQVLYHGLNRLTSAKREVNGQVFEEPMKLDGAVRSRIARNITKLLSAVRPHEKKMNEHAVTFQKKAKEIGPQKDDAPEVAEPKRQAVEALQQQFQEEQKAMAEATEDVDIRPLAYDSLNLEQNLGITAAVIATLLPVLEGVPE